jgi:hypothetical protein
MGLVAIGQLWFFRRRGWIGKGKQRERESHERKSKAEQK